MRINLLRLAEERVLVEQLRLLLGNVGSSVIPAFLLAILMLWSLSNSANSTAMQIWCTAVILSKLICYFHARHHLASSISFDKAHRLTWALLVLNAVDGLLWGALAWVSLDTTTTTGVILVISVEAGIAGSSMSLLSPVLPVFVVFTVTQLVFASSKVFLLGDPMYNALGVAAVLYAATLLAQARNSAIAARAAINLRFENIELIEKAQAARQEAEQANLAKSKFLAAASHDLRQPMHALGLFLEVLARSGLSAAQNEVLTSARAASEAAAGMLNTLLDYSRIEAGVIEPNMRPFHLQPLLNKIEKELAPQANAKGLIYRSRETHAAVHADPALVELILRNLVSNAIRYTMRGGVLVGCRRRGDHVSVEVWDTGIGIAPAQQQEVFREFHQLGNPERDRNKGLGLGLAIAQGLARAMGQELALTSTPQHGSVFRLTLPITLAAVADDGLEAAPLPEYSLNARVLVIDDDDAVRASMVQLLHDWGCECMAAESLEEAQVMARACCPDMVISDYRLRELRTGAQAIVALRAEFGANLPALLITGDTAPERLREARASGVPLLHKPVSPSLLYSRLVSVMADTHGEPAA
jgi:signal transduction histidine kinase